MDGLTYEQRVSKTTARLKREMNPSCIRTPFFPSSDDLSIF
jgi:hypothetical protein